jgi:integrase
MALTVKKVEKLVRSTKRARYADGQGLYLQVPEPAPRNAREQRSCWLFRYERNGKAHWFGLGAVHTFTLYEARERARKARQMLTDGIDPIEASKRQRATELASEAKAKAANVSFEECCEEFQKHHGPKWKSRKHAAQFMSTMRTYAFPVLGKLSVAEIDQPLVLNVLKPIWGTKTETASRVRGRIENVLDFARVSGYRTGENPARWDGNLKHVLPARGQIAEVEHHASLPFDQLPGFMKQLQEREAVAARALEITILCATRTSETIEATWDEINFREKVWTIPKERMKNNLIHIIPLSDKALAILKALPREGNYVFIGGRKRRPMSNAAMDRLLERMGYKDGRATVHGFRSSFKEWARHRTTYADELSELALSHVNDDKTRAAYARSELLEPRRPLMARWAKYCESDPVKTGTNVIALGRATRR